MHHSQLADVSFFRLLLRARKRKGKEEVWSETFLYCGEGLKCCLVIVYSGGTKAKIWAKKVLVLL